TCAASFATSPAHRRCLPPFPTRRSSDLAESAELREVLRVLRDLTDLLRPHRAAIAAAWEMCIAFDDLCARARYAVEVNGFVPERSEEHTSELQSRVDLVCRLLLEKKKHN